MKKPKILLHRFQIAKIQDLFLSSFLLKKCKTLQHAVSCAGPSTFHCGEGRKRPE